MESEEPNPRFVWFNNTQKWLFSMQIFLKSSIPETVSRNSEQGDKNYLTDWLIYCVQVLKSLEVIENRPLILFLWTKVIWKFLNLETVFKYNTFYVMLMQNTDMFFKKIRKI